MVRGEFAMASGGGGGEEAVMIGGGVEGWDGGECEFEGEGAVAAGGRVSVGLVESVSEIRRGGGRGGGVVLEEAVDVAVASEVVVPSSVSVS